MKRSYSLCAVALIAVALVFAWQSSRANDGEKNASAIEGVQISAMLDLVERIETLEKRLATLERSETLVRQADSRELPETDQPKMLVPVPRPAEIERPGEFGDDEAQQTNGQRWRFRLLGHRDTSTSLIH